LTPELIRLVREFGPIWGPVLALVAVAYMCLRYRWNQGDRGWAILAHRWLWMVFVGCLSLLAAWEYCNYRSWRPSSTVSGAAPNTLLLPPQTTSEPQSQSSTRSQSSTQAHRPAGTATKVADKSRRPSQQAKQNNSITVGGVTFAPGSIPSGSVFSIGQQGGITAGTVNNFGAPPLPTPTVKVCATYPDVVAGENYRSVITFTTNSQLPRPFFALFFDGPVLDGSAGRPKGSYGYTHMRADKLPNPERSFAFRTITMELGGTSSWFPSDGPIQATVPSKGPVRLLRVLSGGGDDPDVVFNVNLVFSCD